MARITYQQRKQLPKSSFALPGKKTKSNPAGKGGYPIDTAGRARNALARASQFGSPAVKAAVRAKVHKKFPGIGAAAKARSEGETVAQNRGDTKAQDRRERADFRKRKKG